MRRRGVDATAPRCALEALKPLFGLRPWGAAAGTVLCERVLPHAGCGVGHARRRRQPQCPGRKRRRRSRAGGADLHPLAKRGWWRAADAPRAAATWTVLPRAGRPRRTGRQLGAPRSGRTPRGALAAMRPNRRRDVIGARAGAVAAHTCVGAYSCTRRKTRVRKQAYGQAAGRVSGQPAGWVSRQAGITRTYHTHMLSVHESGHPRHVCFLPAVPAGMLGSLDTAKC
eukprot:366546-Chlamydomonas_euryale.AAC.24